MKKAGLWGLLWMVFISELQAENESKEEKFIKEGETLNVNCPFSTEKYSYSQKAWQKLIDGRKPVTLALTTSTSGNPSQVREGRYFLEDIPSEAILHVQMTNLQVEDSGLYRCVIYYFSKEPDVLSPLFHVVVIKDPLNTTASDENHTRKLQISTFPPTTTRPQGTLVDRPRTVTKLPPKSTADLSSPGFGVNITNVTDVTSYVFRIPSCRRRGETKVTARWRDLDHSLLLKCHALLQPEGLAAGVPAENVYTKVQHLEGETLSVQCSYKSRKSHVEGKVWCKIRRKKCEPGFTRVWTQGPRYLLQDDAKAKVVKITMAALRRQDSGRYWCMRNSSGTLYPLTGFLLEVSPGRIWRGAGLEEKYQELYFVLLSLRCLLEPQVGSRCAAWSSDGGCTQGSSPRFPAAGLSSHRRRRALQSPLQGRPRLRKGWIAHPPPRTHCPLGREEPRGTQQGQPGAEHSLEERLGLEEGRESGLCFTGLRSDLASPAVKAGEYGLDSSPGPGALLVWSNWNKHLGINVAFPLSPWSRAVPGGTADVIVRRVTRPGP
ncbi:uncharacterized protein LOC115513920 isoform X3 [Lynx canadensis]|uniref:uncharacterized protein LOC115513920 isoform X3 n=1 Tax=Lynx canadensis TaxID=61383 RepID=UPI0011B06C98|nr:uncharacterized protein LOC115513920 isoform X3 [Lynx canadensis]